MKIKEKTEAEKIAERLFFKKRNVWERLQAPEKEKIIGFNEDYKHFLDNAKTEREAVAAVIEDICEKGFKRFDGMSGFNPESGAKFYVENRGKALAAGIIGRRPFENGINLVVAHLDSPRLDLKPQPVYEKEGLVYFNTHYYGGIKKYQWTTIPLALHGVVIRADGESLNITIGENEDDPVFCITDLLPHLSRKQLKKRMGEFIEGENLDLVAGSIPYGEEEVNERVKFAVLLYLHRKYGMVEGDFVSAELEAVPAGKARDIGLDRGLLGAYGQDDRVCSYTAIRALTDLEQPEKTCLVFLLDKEEIGSTGNTGAQSRFLEHVIGQICGTERGKYYSALHVLSRSKALSGDVNAAWDPLYGDVMDKDNAASLGNGVVLTKYTGSGGKYQTNDASAEFVNYVKRVFEKGGIIWQTGELGKVDQGGGGTVAQFLANYGMDVVDCGVPVLNMHAPLEITSKADVYMAWKAYKAFFQEI